MLRATHTEERVLGGCLGCSVGKLTVTVVVNECRLILLLVRVSFTPHSLDKHRVIKLILGNSVSLAKRPISSLSEVWMVCTFGTET